MNYRPDQQVETCGNWKDSPSQEVDLAFNLFFMVFFIIRVSNMIPISQWSYKELIKNLPL